MAEALTLYVIHGSHPCMSVEAGLRVRDEYVPALSGHLDHVDALMAGGVLGGDQVNVADLQMAGSIRLLQTFEDLREAIDARPCGRLARRLVPDYDGGMPRGAIDSPL